MSINNNHKLLVISLDGLAFEQVLQLETAAMPVISSFSQKCRLVSQTSHPLVDNQAMWAEILTGQPWFASGCPGYAKPLSNLNETKIVSEADFSADLRQIQPVSGSHIFAGNTLGSKEQPAVIINMPLLLPDDNSRIWLADGSMPLMTAVSPQKFVLKPPFNTYKARAFAASANHLADLSKAVKSCLEVEYQRLTCAQQLLQNESWQTCFLRISAFDILQHLLGAELLEATKISLWKDIEEFLVCLNDTLAAICQLTDNVAVISTFHLSPCYARLNLNDLLHQGGFCNFAQATTESNHLSRRQASQAVASSKSAISAQAEAIVARSNYLDCSMTTAASPVAGQIYLNRASCFNDGTVADVQADTLMAEVRDYLINYFQNHLPAADVSVISIANALQQKKIGSGHDSSGQAPDQALDQAQSPNSQPDLLVYIAGVDFHNTYGQGIIDRLHHPRSVHAPGGFAFFRQSQSLAKDIDTRQVHEILKGALK